MDKLDIVLWFYWLPTILCVVIDSVHLVRGLRDGIMFRSGYYLKKGLWDLVPVVNIFMLLLYAAVWMMDFFDEIGDGYDD